MSSLKVYLKSVVTLSIKTKDDYSKTTNISMPYVRGISNAIMWISWYTFSMKIQDRIRIHYKHFKMWLRKVEKEDQETKDTL